MGYEVDLRDNYAKVHEKFFPPPSVPLRLSEKETREALEAVRSRAQQLENDLKLMKARMAVMERAISPVIIPGCPHIPRITLEKILQTVCKNEAISKSQILSPQRERSIADARHIAFYLSAALTLTALTRIGRYFHRDHTTVLHGIRKLKALRLTDKALDERLKAYEAALTKDAEAA